MSIAEFNAAQSEFYRTHDRTQDAGPEWEDLTEAEQAEEWALGERSVWSPLFEQYNNPAHVAFADTCEGECDFHGV